MLDQAGAILRALQQRTEAMLRDAERAAQRLRYAEQRVRELGGGAGSGGVAGGAPASGASAYGFVVRTTSTVTAMSGTTPGTGTGTPQLVGGALADDAGGLSLINVTEKAVASGSYAVATPVTDSTGAVRYVLTVVDKCVHLS